VSFLWRIATDVVRKNRKESFRAVRRVPAEPFFWSNPRWALKPGAYFESKPVTGRCLQEIGAILKKIVGDLAFLRQRLRQTDANELACGPRSAVQPELEMSSNRFDTSPITFESVAEVLDRFATPLPDPEMVERPQVDPMGWK
jgi:hypothetical protein